MHSFFLSGTVTLYLGSLMTDLPRPSHLVAEGREGGAPKLTPKDVIAGYIMAQGNSSVKGGDRLTLLRDGDGDGVYENHTVFAENLNAPVHDRPVVRRRDVDRRHRRGTVYA